MAYNPGPNTVGIALPPVEWFMGRVSVGDDGCWYWDDSGTRYGRLTWAGCRMYAHRVAYMLFKGPLTEGLVVDHLCRHLKCCNPAHLEEVTNVENVMRGVSTPALNATKESCPAGHLYTDKNTYVCRRGRRQCRRCNADKKKAVYPRDREKLIKYQSAYKAAKREEARSGV